MDDNPRPDPGLCLDGRRLGPRQDGGHAQYVRRPAGPAHGLRRRAAVTLIGFPSRQLQNLFSILRKPFVARLEEPAELIGELVQLAEVARKDGLLALEARARDIRDPFVALGIQLAVDGTRPEVLAEIMNSEVESRAARHREAKKIVELVGRCGPAFGMIATLLGLILMLGNLENPDTIGPSMAIALIGTLYGALLANLICIPLGEKLSYLSHEELLARQIVIRGVLAIQAATIRASSGRNSTCSCRRDSANSRTSRPADAMREFRKKSPKALRSGWSPMPT